ncbi:MAG: hypothetical protein IT510_10435 [Sulfuritalea sp.]|jgi:hypothetical protein|nr:hypothetical protein [Sulfuritalea sp.]
MKPLLATLITLASLLLAAPAAVACADENGCRNRPEASTEPAAKPQTRALKKKPKKECHGSLACERSASADTEAKPQTRALKKKPKKEACADENTCR